MTKTSTRLFKQFNPEHYNLEITPNADTMTFSGSVVITGKKTGRPNQRLTFHQKGLTITEATVIKHDKLGEQTIVIDRVNNHDSYDEVRLHSKDMIYPGSYTVHMKFEGTIIANMLGLYPCTFEHEGAKKTLLATQFESHHAREVFPHIDEPEAKATFDLTLITPAHETVLGNTPIKKQIKHGDNQLKTTFETSPIMSSYLLAFAIGEIHGVSGTTKNGVAVNSWSTVAHPKESLSYANAEAIQILEFFEDYFGTPFPLKKLDQIALPDFEVGAMENWGLITYREVLLLSDPKNRSVMGEQTISMVIAHEISHQWFGNLVTMQWWDDLWLNESFASLMEHVALAALHPDWQQWEQYAASDIITCSSRDIYKDVQSVKTPVNHVDEIGTLFDPAIVYTKGGRLLKMMHDYIGEAAFRQGLKSYFKKHAYKNTIRDDLWTEMSAASNKDINALMNPWLEQSGMPVLKIEPGDTDNTRAISQSRFVLDAQDDPRTWLVPLLPSKPLDIDLLETKTDTIAFDGDLPLFNEHGSGHFVTHYASDNDLATIIQQVETGTVSSEARINIMNDLMLLARRGDDSLVDALKLVEKLNNEPRDAVWALMCRAIGLASNIGEGDELIENGIKKLKYLIAHKNHQKLGWDDTESEDPNTKTLRATMIGLMLGAEDKTTIDAAQKLFTGAQSAEAMPADRRGLILGTVVRHGNDPKTIQSLIELYKSTPNPELQHALCGALTHSKDAKINEKIIREALGEDGFVRPQDVFRWFAYLMRNKYSRDMTWDWMTSSWDRLEEVFASGKSLDTFVIYSAGPIQTKEWHSKFQTFFNPKRDRIELQRKIDVANSEISARIAWRDRDLNAMQDYFSSL